jgi:hypothetical protein
VAAADPGITKKQWKKDVAQGCKQPDIAPKATTSGNDFPVVDTTDSLDIPPAVVAKYEAVQAKKGVQGAALPPTYQITWWSRLCSFISCDIWRAQQNATFLYDQLWAQADGMTCDKWAEPFSILQVGIVLDDQPDPCYYPITEAGFGLPRANLISRQLFVAKAQITIPVIGGVDVTITYWSVNWNNWQNEYPSGSERYGNNHL